MIERLPAIVDHAHDPSLRTAFADHLAQTRQQVNRLENAFALAGLNPKRNRCEAMKGLLAACKRLLNAVAEPAIKDAALIAAIQRIKLYKIASYGAVRNFAMRCEQAGIADLLQQSLDEEGDADQRLTEIAEQIVNADAARV